MIRSTSVNPKWKSVCQRLALLEPLLDEWHVRRPIRLSINPIVLYSPHH